MLPNRTADCASYGQRNSADKQSFHLLHALPLDDDLV